jgi:hypothetical protein
MPLGCAGFGEDAAPDSFVASVACSIASGGNTIRWRGPPGWWPTMTPFFRSRRRVLTESVVAADNSSMVR